MENQSINSKKGEIEFRKKLVQQQIEGVQNFEDEFDADGIESILKDRMQKTIDQMTAFKNKGILKAPFIEIGAERGQRSLAIENSVGIKGAAVDISFDMLRSCNYYKDKFKQKNTPMLVCCDAHSLPFMTGSIPFAFCYETLHHFNEPAPIVKEIHRVLVPGGNFFFDEEPHKRVLHLNLYTIDKNYSKKTLSRNKFQRALGYFFANKPCNETDFGIIENDDITIASWKKALSVFDKKEVTFSFLNIHSKLYNPKNPFKYLIAYLLGGNITALCTKAGTFTGKENTLEEILICPSCNDEKREAKLVKKENHFECTDCGKKYPIVDNVAMLFSYEKFEELYPEIFGQIKSL